MSAGEEPQGTTIGDWELARHVSEWIEIGAIACISAAVVVALVQMARSALAGQRGKVAFEAFKRPFSHGVLLGLDLLVAADIISTVTLDPNLNNFASLGLLVVVRTVLAWSLVLEAEGRWPWQVRQTETPSAGPHQHGDTIGELS